MTANEMPAGEFKAKCLAVLDDVAASGREVVVTKRGKAVAKVVPLEAGPRRMVGCMEGTARIVVPGDELFTAAEEWEIARTDGRIDP